ncbi:MAG: hypothetical protein ACLURP_16580 [Ruminococcus sp.]
MKEKRHLVMWVEIYRVGGAAGKAGNCENPGECKRSAGICLCRAGTGRCAEGVRKREKKLSVTK